MFAIYNDLKKVEPGATKELGNGCFAHMEVYS
jgi:hypothetical protein